MTHVLAFTIFFSKIRVGVTSYLKSRGELRHFRGGCRILYFSGGGGGLKSWGGGVKRIGRGCQHPIPHYELYKTAHPRIYQINQAGLAKDKVERPANRIRSIAHAVQIIINHF